MSKREQQRIAKRVIEKLNGDSKWFTAQGSRKLQIPVECVSDCSGAGDVSESVKYWADKLEFSCPRKIAIPYLRDIGAWELDELEAADDQTLTERVLWIECGNIREDAEETVKGS